jgi:hypothetical protein
MFPLARTSTIGAGKRIFKNDSDIDNEILELDTDPETSSG